MEGSETKQLTENMKRQRIGILNEIIFRSYFYNFKIKDITAFLCIYGNNQQ
jgi:phage gp29-like protein